MATKEGDRFGVFYIPQGIDALIVIFDDGTYGEPINGTYTGSGWEHLSCRVKMGKGQERVPSYSELNWLKQLFWDDEECVMHLYPPKSEHVNNHPFVLHLWRPLHAEIPRPRKELV